MYRRRPFCGRSERLADIASPDLRRDSRGVSYEFWTTGCWWKSPTGLRRFFRYAMFIYSFYLCYVLSLYPFTERYAQLYFFSCLIRQMVNTRTDADLFAAVQNALQTLLPQIHEEIREEFRTGSGSSNAGGNPTPVTIHTWLERFNKQNPIPLRRRQLP
nr:hypothetical protein [Tanacetum cinerariifolium]